MSDWEIGVFSSWDEASKRWLEKEMNRKAIVISSEPVQLPINALYFPAPTLIHREVALRKVGQMTAFSNVQVFSSEFKNTILHAKLHAEMRLSDLSDLGIRNMEHLLKNGRLHLSSLHSIQNSLKNTPAVVIGAGPSLQDSEEILKNLKGKALLIGAGTGFRKSPVEPDLFFTTDPHLPMDRSRYPSAPICIQGRVHPDTLKNAPDQIFYVPDSHLPLEGWLMAEEVIFDAGWNAANGAVEVAHILGCSPIYLIGVDLCYLDGKKYADEEGAIASLVEFEGKKTQRDWLLAIEWFRQKEQEYELLNLSQKGIQVGKFVPSVNLKTKCPKFPIAKPVRLRNERLAEWKEALEIKNALAQSLLLDPLWDVWSSLFENENTDLNIHKQLFYDRAVQEYLQALKEEIVTYYPDGKLKTVQHFWGALRDGESLLYWPNGQLKRKTIFKEGQKIGEQEFFDEEGNRLA